MSEFLFAHSKVDPRTLRLRLAAVGVVGFLLLGVLTGVLGLQTLGVVSDDVRVTVQLPTVGDTLGINSDVKYDGLRVGRVIEVDPAGPSARVLVAPEHAALIPARVAARVLPGTLFGNEYVDLVSAESAESAATTRAHLADGAVVPADTSTATLRLMDTFSATQRLLAAVDPAQWDVALSQLADALDGRGARIAELVRDGNAFLGRWADLHPQVRKDLDLLAHDTDLAADVEPRLVEALRDTRPLARTLVRQRAEVSQLLADLPALLDGETGMTTFLRENGAATARLLNASAATLEVFAERYPTFAELLRKVPALLRNGAGAVRNGRIQMEGVLAPQLLDPYDPADPKDCPTYRGLTGPCGGRR
ncbi:MCE family protein [Nocardioides daeguensis]|uniref:MCE family protein n=1 Tax=Nocardioides daeguensis TaxID=908359 RepID=A0ABP6WIE6_9ACTN|nr:MCE family protein [Nocardioides daeguensis]MBV6729051.1 MCE family protein [Nocardioides daeguensis]MCR1774945.1 MCE family protein [Nocardioides daeguensis]